jgi:SAM-dependent methyltransferase
VPDPFIELLFERDGNEAAMRNSGDLFDEYAKSYDVALGAALEISGEGREYFAYGRVSWLAGCLTRLREQPRAALDFGCGDGKTAPLLRQLVKVDRVLGVDVSAQSIEVARKQCSDPAIAYCAAGSFRPEAQMDLAYCNGVFHHIPPPERPAGLQAIHAALRPGGVFAFWENNPWNPATHYVMSRCAFDNDAQMLSPLVARRLLKQAGFAVLRTDYLFVFPRGLKVLRGLEPALSDFPLGTQYQVLCRKV